MQSDKSETASSEASILISHREKIAQDGAAARKRIDDYTNAARASYARNVDSNPRLISGSGAPSDDRQLASAQGDLAATVAKRVADDLPGARRPASTPPCRERAEPSARFDPSDATGGLAAAFAELIAADLSGGRRFAAAPSSLDQSKPSAGLGPSDSVSSLAAAVTEQIQARRF